MDQQFLVIQTAFIGDVVLATGIIEKLRHFFPNSRIDFLVRKGNEGLLINHPFLREVIVWDKQSGKMRNLVKLVSYIRSKKYDKVINVQRFAATGILTAFSGAKEKIGFDKNPMSFLFTKKVKHIVAAGPASRHEIERNNDLIADFTDPIPFKPRLYPSQSDYQKVEYLKTVPYITISPASVWFTKQYPKSEWVKFINRLPDSVTIFLLGGPADAGLANEIKQESIRPVITLCGQLNFLQSTALMKDALMNYVNDSAPLHFASAVNGPVTAVYCSTLPSFGFGPVSDNSFIVEIPEPLYCRPCGLHGRSACPEGHFLCAFKISENQLLATLNSLQKSI